MDRMQLTLHSHRKFTLLLLACYTRGLNTAVLLRWVTLRKCSQTSSPADEWMCCCSHCATWAGGSFFYLDPIVMAKKHKCHLVTIPPITAVRVAILGVPTASVIRNSAWSSDLLRRGVHRCVPDEVVGGTCLGRAICSVGPSGENQYMKLSKL